jgi:hypothetical protein
MVLELLTLCKIGGIIMNKKDGPTALQVLDLPVMPEEFFDLKLKGQSSHPLPSKQIVKNSNLPKTTVYPV